MALGESEGDGGEDNMGLLSSPSQPLSNTITPLGFQFLGTLFASLYGYF